MYLKVFFFFNFFENSKWQPLTKVKSLQNFGWVCRLHFVFEILWRSLDQKFFFHVLQENVKIAKFTTKWPPNCYSCGHPVIILERPLDIPDTCFDFISRFQACFHFFEFHRLWCPHFGGRVIHYMLKTHFHWVLVVCKFWWVFKFWKKSLLKDIVSKKEVHNNKNKTYNLKKKTKKLEKQSSTAVGHKCVLKEKDISAYMKKSYQDQLY